MLESTWQKLLPQVEALVRMPVSFLGFINLGAGHAQLHSCRTMQLRYMIKYGACVLCDER